MHSHLIAFQPMARRGPLRPFALALASVDVVAAWAIVVAVCFMVAIVGVQVVLRYLFNSSLSWSEELSRLAFIWAMFLGIPLGVRYGAHIGINVLTVRLPELQRRLLARGVALVGAAMMCLVAWQSVRIAWEQWDEFMVSVDLSSGWFMLAVAFGAAHSMLHLLWIVLHGPHEIDDPVLEGAV